jgi:FkbM family methyltransferase
MSLLVRGGGRPTVEPLGKAAWLVQEPPDVAGPGLSVRALGDSTWVVRRRGRRARSVQRIGPPALGTHLLFDRRATRERMRVHHQSLLNHVAEEHVAWVLRELEVNCVLDVGANAGQYAERLRRAGYPGRIVSFEPVSSVADQLEAAATGDPEWHVRRCALGRTAGEAEMQLASGMGRMSSMLPPSEFGKAWSSRLAAAGVESVPVRRLDDLFEEVTAGIASPRVYLKLDTQGYDLEAFAGAAGCLDDVVGMQSEVSSVPIYDGMPRLPDQIATYESAGFQLTGMFPVSVDAPTMRVIEFDAVMVRPEALAPTSTDATP